MEKGHREVARNIIIDVSGCEILKKKLNHINTYKIHVEFYYILFSFRRSKK